MHFRWFPYAAKCQHVQHMTDEINNDDDKKYIKLLIQLKLP